MEGERFLLPMGVRFTPLPEYTRRRNPVSGAVVWRTKPNPGWCVGGDWDTVGPVVGLGVVGETNPIPGFSVSRESVTGESTSGGCCRRRAGRFERLV
jgi:hypothetical protein